MVSHKEIEDRAAAWLAQRDSGNWTPEDQSHLAGWLGEAIAHRVAFLRLEDVRDQTRRLKAVGAGRVPGIVPPPGQWRNGPFFDLDRQPQVTIEVDAPLEFGAPREFIERSGGVANRDMMRSGEKAPLDELRGQRPEELSLEVGQFGSTILDPEVAASSDAISHAGEDSLEAAPQKNTPFISIRPRAPARWRSWTVAAGLLFALGIGAYIIFSPAADRFSTPIGGMASVPLRDGSNITLNTASRVRVELTASERLIDLQQGEAFFKVAKDPARPFVVRVGDRRVVAVGTQFSVRRDGNDIRVVVTEGTVRLESANRALSGRSQGSGPELTSDSSEEAGVRASSGNAGSAMPVSTSLPAGTIARAAGEDVLVENESVSRAEELLSWRQGYLRFHDTTLAEAIAEFNRYNERTITIDDPAVASIRISGTFRPTSYEAFVRLLRDGFSLRTEEKGDRIVLTKN